MRKKLNILSWNVRGLSQPNKCSRVKNFIRSCRTDIIMLQETKINEWDFFALRNLLPSYFDTNSAHLAARNSCEGCLLAWRRCYSFLNSWATPHSISTVLIDDRTGHNFTITTVYGPQLEAAKLQFIHELSLLRPPPRIPWLIEGDFNLVRWVVDRPNSTPDWGIMDSFNDAIRNHHLFDVPLSDRKYTWSNKQPIPNHSKIDRIFLSPSFLTAFAHIILKAEPMVTSDHVPLILTCSQSGSSPSATRLEKFWFKYDYFDRITKHEFANPLGAPRSKSHCSSSMLLSAGFTPDSGHDIAASLRNQDPISKTASSSLFSSTP